MFLLKLKQNIKKEMLKFQTLSSNKSIFNPNVLILKDSDLYRYIDFNLRIISKKKK